MIAIKLMVEIFKTDVTRKRNAVRIIKLLNTTLPGYCFNFDLEDPDRILRVQGLTCAQELEAIINMVRAEGVAISLITE